MGIFYQQRLMLMLAVNINQHFTQRTQLLQRRRLTVDIGFGFAIGIDYPAQQTLVRIIALLQIVAL